MKAIVEDFSKSKMHHTKTKMMIICSHPFELIVVKQKNFHNFQKLSKKKKKN